MKFSSSPSQASVNQPSFSAVTVRGWPATKVLTIQSGLLFSVTASVTRYVRGSGPSIGRR